LHGELHKIRVDRARLDADRNGSHGGGQRNEEGASAQDSWERAQVVLEGDSPKGASERCFEADTGVCSRLRWVGLNRKIGGDFRSNWLVGSRRSLSCGDAPAASGLCSRVCVP